MALDFFHAAVTDLATVNNITEKLKFRKIGDLDTLEPIYPVKKDFCGLTFTLTKPNGFFIIKVQGSLHHFYNLIHFRIKQNFDDFTFTQQEVALKRLAEELNCDLKHLKVTSFEFGVNLRCGRNPNEVIENCLYYDIKVGFETEKFENGGFQKIFKRDSYLIKIYNKSIQSNLLKNDQIVKIDDLIRLEIKYKDSQYCKRVKIYSLDDFHRFDKVNKLYKEIKKHWSKILLLDTLDPEKIVSEKEREIFTKYIAINYFDSETNGHFKGRHDRRSQYEKLIEILSNNKLLSIHEDLTLILEAKCNFLLKLDNEQIERIMIKIFREEIDIKDLPKEEIYDQINLPYLLKVNKNKSFLLKEVYQAIQRLKDARHL